MNTIKKYLAVGCGGIDCSCCFPPKGHRKAEFRKAKRKEAIEMKKEIEQEIETDYEFPKLWDL